MFFTGDLWLVASRHHTCRDDLICDADDSGSRVVAASPTVVPPDRSEAVSSSERVRRSFDRVQLRLRI